MIRKVYGAPGTGKTTYLQKILAEECGSIKELRKVLFISFSNAAIDAIYDKLNLPRKSLKNFTTLHGLCTSFAVSWGSYYSMEFIPKRVKNTFKTWGFVNGEYAKFCKAHGIRYSFDDPLQEEGNIAISSWQKVVAENYIKHRDYEYCYSILEKNDPKSADIVGKWFAWKEDKEVCDFIDILVFAYENIDEFKKFVSRYEMAMFDEVQDFSPLEWKLVDAAIEAIGDAYLAGDDCQTIYTFKGADARLFLKHEHNEEIILPKSYRLPSNILSFSDEILTLMSDKKIKNVEPAKEGGYVHIFQSYWDIYDIIQCALSYIRKYNSVFVLFRTNYQAEQALELCLTHGILPKVLKTSEYYKFWNKDLPVLCECIQQLCLKKNYELSKDELAVLFKYTKKQLEQIYHINMDEVISNLLKGQMTLDMVEITQSLKHIDWMSMLEMSENKHLRRFLSNDTCKMALRNGLTPVNIYIDTVHASKGLEADVVIYVDGITQKIAEEINRYGDVARDNELRVGYVGCTRAREVLIVCPMKNMIPYLTKMVGRG